MFGELFSNWTNPGLIVAIVAFRVLFNVGIAVYVANTAGIRSSLTLVSAVLAAFSAVATVTLLSSGWPGHSVSYLEQASQVSILAVSAYVALRVDSRPVSDEFTIAWLGAFILLFVMVTVYGEAFVAP